MTKTRNCQYDSRCKAPRAYKVTEKAVGAYESRTVYCCAQHYPGNKTMPAPAQRHESAFYVLEPINGEA